MTICAALSTGLSAQSVYPGQHAGKMKKVTTAPMQVESFDLKDVRLLPSRFRDNMMRDSAWMTSKRILQLPFCRMRMKMQNAAVRLFIC